MGSDVLMEADMFDMDLEDLVGIEVLNSRFQVQSTSVRCKTRVLTRLLLRTLTILLLNVENQVAFVLNCD